MAVIPAAQQSLAMALAPWRAQSRWASRRPLRHLGHGSGGHGSEIGVGVSQRDESDLNGKARFGGTMTAGGPGRRGMRHVRIPRQYRGRRALPPRRCAASESVLQEASPYLPGRGETRHTARPMPRIPVGCWR
jgi:hypothetical protein